MEKTQKAKAIKKLQNDLKEEKQAEITRYISYSSFSPRLTQCLAQTERNNHAAKKSGRGATEIRRGQGQGLPFATMFLILI